MKKRLLAGLLTGLLAMSAAFTGVSADEAGAAAEFDISEEVQLSMYVISDRPAGQDVVEENLNRLLKEKLNCTLQINYLSWAEFQNKYPMIFSSGEQFDIAYTSNWLNFFNMAQRGAFMELDDLWPTYAPKNYERQTEAGLRQATVNDHYYCIPTLLPTYSSYCPAYRTDIMEGTDWSGKMETWEDFEEYLEIVKETHPEMEPVDVFQMGSEIDDAYMYSLGYRPVSGSQGGMFWYDPTLEEPKVMTYYEIAETPEFLAMMARWNEKGFFTKSALSDTDSTKLQDGKAAFSPRNLDQYENICILHPEYGLEFAPIVKNVCHLPFLQDAMVVSNTSKNPERALMFWDLLTSDQEVFDAYYYGVLGTTYELNDEGQFRILDPDLYATGAMWSARTKELNRSPIGSPEAVTEIKADLEEQIAENDCAEKYTSFSMDTTGLETEYATCTNVHQQYWYPLELGYVDAEKGLEDYEKNMKAAGVEKLQAALQEQLDAYTASLK